MKHIYLGIVLVLAFFSLTISPAGAAPYKVIVLENPGLPLTSFNIVFKAGSAYDPPGFEGLANLTGQLVREGGVAAYKGLPARTRAEFEDVFFPLAASIHVLVQKEQISFQVTSAAKSAEKVFDLLSQMIIAPALDAHEFERLRTEEKEALVTQMPREDQEELGKAVLDQRIYGEGHPYRHLEAGTLDGLNKITLESVRTYYRNNFNPNRITVGVAGVVSSQLRKKIETAFVGLNTNPTKTPRLQIVKGPFDATGVHLGVKLAINRAHPDFAALYLASAAFGKHRSFVGRLMNVVREERGLNYGTYAYVENFPAGGHLLVEPTQVARRSQAFTVWARPSTPENGCFLLRQVHREVVSLVRSGLTEQEFERTQSHMLGNIPLLAVSLERQLGYAMDSDFYGISGDYLVQLQKRVKALTRAQVNAALRKYIDLKGIEIVVVTADPEKFKQEILAPRCEIHYGQGIQKSSEVLEEDRKISEYRLPLTREDISVVDSETVFKQ